VNSIRDWLESNGLGTYAELFAENEIDLDLLPQLTESDLEKLGLSVGARRRLVLAIESLGTSDLQEGSEHAAESAHAERRQLTVLFCDLVGSTSLSQRLDPEALRELMGRYQQNCRTVVEKYDGHVAQYLGDGVMVYFGWPRAHEDDAERSVRAALEIVDKIAKSGNSDDLHVRIGIATGPVVVGESGKGEAAAPSLAVGETPNLASRLQGLAGVDEIVISPNTYRLVGAAIAVEDTGEQNLKGIVEPVRAWRVTGLGHARARFDESPKSGETSSLVGRKSELTLLLERWEQAREGEGHVVLLCGEPGLGKSRLTQAVREGISKEDYICMRYQCSAYHSSTALHPVVEHLEYAAGFAHGDTDQIRLTKLESLVAQATDNLEKVVPLLASLLSVDYTSKYDRLTVTPQMQKELTLRALVDQVTGLSASKPVLMIIEDTHWIDPTTQELFDMLMPAIVEQPVFLIVTFRPEYQPQWHGMGHVTPLTLNRLPRRQSAAMAEAVSGGTTLSKEVIDEIVAKTDGVPLFVEELTKSVVESCVRMLGEGGQSQAGTVSDLAIPSTLQDSLMARLDRLESAKDVAQVGACIGREFGADLLAAVSKMSADDLAAAARKLVDSELIYVKESLDGITYVFKHALVQETAYSSLLHSRREQVHADIADALERLLPDLAKARPEMLAHHCWHAGRFDDAIEQWLIAGRKAVQQASNLEGITYLERALDGFNSLPSTDARKKQELAVRMVLGPALLAIKGWASREAYENYERARVLCDQFTDAPEMFATLWGIWVYRMTSSGSAMAMEVADELLRLSAREKDNELELQARHAAWSTMVWTGKLDAALEHVQAGLAIYDIDAHRTHALRFGGHDPGVCGYGQGALALWLRGYVDQAFASAQEGIALGRKLNHAPSLVHGQVFASFIYHPAGETQVVASLVDEIDRISSENGLSLYMTYGEILGGWVRSVMGETAAGLEQMQDGVKRYDELQMRTGAGYIHSILAETFARDGKIDEALNELDTAMGWSEKSGDRYWDAEILRLKGAVTLQTSSPDESASEQHFLKAMDVAHEMSARSLELRAAISLSALWQRQGKRNQAHDLLAPIYSLFTVGFDTSDLKEAKGLLEELSA
jgi:predicted ATPase/class 3 adenylate cyclase